MQAVLVFGLFSAHPISINKGSMGSTAAVGFTCRRRGLLFACACRLRGNQNPAGFPRRLLRASPGLGFLDVSGNNGFGAASLCATGAAKSQLPKAQAGYCWILEGEQGITRVQFFCLLLGPLRRAEQGAAEASIWVPWLPRFPSLTR